MKKVLRGLLIISAVLVFFAVGYVLGAMYLDINPQSFTTVDGMIAFSDGDNLYPTISMLEEDFEGTDAFLDLFDAADPVFTSVTLQSPAAPSVEDYVALRKCIFSGGCDFEDNRIDINQEIVYSGQNALRFYSVTPRGENVSKTSLDTTLLHIAKGDHLWFSAYYYVAQGMPRTIADFETSALKGGPGPRLVLLGDLVGESYLGLELKHGFKPIYRQEKDPITFPRERWVHVLLHLTLSNRSDGLIQIWQDCQLIVDAQGKNLPKGGAILDRMQLGITATDRETTLFVDDVYLVIGSVDVATITFCP